MDITYEPTFSGYPVNSDKERGLGCYSKGLGILQSKLESMTESHSKVLITGVVLRYPQDGSVEPSSRDITVFNKNLIRDLERNNILPGKRQTPGKKKERTKQSPQASGGPVHHHRLLSSMVRIRIPTRTSSSCSTGTPKGIPVMFRKELPGPGKQLSVWRTVQAWSTTAKSSTFWIVHLLAFSRQCRTRFTTIAIPSK